MNQARYEHEAFSRNLFFIEGLRKEWANDVIFYQYRFHLPYKFKKVRGKDKNKIVSIRHIRVDFFNATKKIVIEIDDKSHDAPNIQAQDKIRDKKLIEQGYQVMRMRHMQIVRKTFRLSGELSKKLKIKAKEEGISDSALIRRGVSVILGVKQKNFTQL